MNIDISDQSENSYNESRREIEALKAQIEELNEALRRSAEETRSNIHILDPPPPTYYSESTS